jgi:hypothetical protein
MIYFNNKGMSKPVKNISKNLNIFELKIYDMLNLYI